VHCSRFGESASIVRVGFDSLIGFNTGQLQSTAWGIGCYNLAVYAKASSVFCVGANVYVVRRNNTGIEPGKNEVSSSCLQTEGAFICDVSRSLHAITVYKVRSLRGR